MFCGLVGSARMWGGVVEKAKPVGGARVVRWVKVHREGRLSGSRWCETWTVLIKALWKQLLPPKSLNYSFVFFSFFSHVLELVSSGCLGVSLVTANYEHSNGKVVNNGMSVHSCQSISQDTWKWEWINQSNQMGKHTSVNIETTDTVYPFDFGFFFVICLICC